MNNDWGPEDGCLKCNCLEMIAGEIIHDDYKTYRVWRCGECGEEARELLLGTNAFGRFMDYLWIKDEEGFEMWFEEEFLSGKGVKEPESDFHTIIEESISETLRYQRPIA